MIKVKKNKSKTNNSTKVLKCVPLNQALDHCLQNYFDILQKDSMSYYTDTCTSMFILASINSSYKMESI